MRILDLQAALARYVEQHVLSGGDARALVLDTDALQAIVDHANSTTTPH